MKYFNIQNIYGSSPGPYSVYYNTINDGSLGTLALLSPSDLDATGISLTQLYDGFDIQVPDNTVVIYIYNEYCEDSQKIVLPTPAGLKLTTGENGGNCFCLTLNNIKNRQVETLEFCDNGYLINEKPAYSNESKEIIWNTNGYWELTNYSSDGVVFRSTDNREMPLSDWFGLGNNSVDFIVTSNEGSCNNSTNNDVFLLTQIHSPSCVGKNDGAIVASIDGGTGYTENWVFSLDGNVFQNTTGIFTSLQSNLYTVYAKNIINESIISKSVELISTPISYFSIPGNLTVTELPSMGNMKYYLAKVEYNTSLIPLGETVNFDYYLNYNLNYLQPGTVTFDTSQHTIYKNSVSIPINTESIGTFSQISPSPCNQSYYQYGTDNVYQSTGISLVNGDTFIVNCIYGIDTNSDGYVDGTCYTKGWVNANLFFKNVSITCPCCQLNSNSLNVNQQPQIFQV